MKKLAAIVIVLWSALVCAAFAPFYVPAINVVSASNSCASLDSSTTALVARMTVDPGCPRKLVINDLIVSLKTAGVWAKLDVLYLFAAADSQSALLNWVSTSYNGTAVNSPVFTVDRGFTGNGSNAYIDSNFNPSSASIPKFVRDDAHLSFWSRTASMSSIGDAGYCCTVTGIRLYARDNSDLAGVRMNGATSTNVTNTNGDGHFVGRRSTSTNQALFRNGTMLTSTSSSSSVIVQNLSINFLRTNTNYSTRQFANASIGGNLTDTEISDFHTALQTYMTAVGAYP